MNLRIDDLEFTSMGCAMFECVSGLTSALAFILDEFRSALSLPFALQKFSLTADSTALLHLAKTALGQYGGTCDSSLKNLGLTFQSPQAGGASRSQSDVIASPRA